MKLKQLFLGAVCASALLSTTSHAQSGGQFDLSWSTIDSGGGTSSGGQFQLCGTIGQTDAGALAGGNFTLDSGFWSSITLIQMPGAPILTIKLIGGGMAVISWPKQVSGFTLEECTALNSGAWSGTDQAVVDTATEHTVTVPAAKLMMKYYRLKRP